MKIQKFNESREYKAIQFQDEYLIVHKVTEGTSKGLIKFKFYDEIDKGYTNVNSMVLGSTKILDTQYEKNETIRNVTILDKYKKVHSATFNIAMRSFFQAMANLASVSLIPQEIDKLTWSDWYKNNTKPAMEMYFDDLEDVKNLGDLLDTIRKIRERFFVLEEDEFKEFLLQKNIDKYNL